MTPRVQRYYELALAARKTRSLVEKLAYHREAVGLLADFVKDESFRPRASISCIQEGAVLFAAAGQVAVLRHVLDTVSATPQLRRWRRAIENALRLAQIADTMMVAIRLQPGVTERDLAAVIPEAAMSSVKAMSSRMAGLGRIRRIAAGPALGLYPPS